MKVYIGIITACNHIGDPESMIVCIDPSFDKVEAAMNAESEGIFQYFEKNNMQERGKYRAYCTIDGPVNIPFHIDTDRPAYPEEQGKGRLPSFLDSVLRAGENKN